jgi:RNase H-fold protein (predicted Holliday junction resolvase)
MIMADGVTPANEGRGYVLRRLLRRVVRSIRLLGYQDASLPSCCRCPGTRWPRRTPEVDADFERISTYAYAEEETFAQTLRAGTAILDTAVRETKQSGGTDAVRAAGVPAARHVRVPDRPDPGDGRRAGADRRRGRVPPADGRAAAAGEGRRAVAQGRRRRRGLGRPYRQLRERGATDFIAHSRWRPTRPCSDWSGTGELVSGATEGEQVELVLDVTPFYAESGGPGLRRRHDHRRRARARGRRRAAADQGAGRAHRAGGPRRGRGRPVGARAGRPGVAARRLPGALGHARRARGAAAGARPDRAAVRLLQPARATCGSDFSWPQQLSADTRSEVEEVANLAIRADLPVQAFYTSLPEARRIGALALFGETYDEEVRVVEIGGEWSRELCGGTHVLHSSQVGPLAITSETSVGAGMRRVEALVGRDFFGYLRRERALVDGLTQTLRVPADQVPERVQSLLDRLRAAEKELDRLRAESVLAGAGALAAAAKDVGGVAVVAAEVPAASAAASCARWCSTCAAGCPRTAAASSRSPPGPTARSTSWWPPTRRPGCNRCPPARWCGRWRRRSAVAAAARTTSPRAAGTEPDGIPQAAAAGRGCRRPAGQRLRVTVTDRPPEPWTDGVRIGVDVGTVRVGVAASDPGGVLASPLATLARDPRGVRGSRQAGPAGRRTGRRSRSSSGCPRRCPGKSGPAARAAREYAEALASRIHPVPVRLSDERLTTGCRHSAARRRRHSRA